MTKEELRDRFYVETGILEPFERVEEYMSWLEDNVIELSKLNQPTVMSTVCEHMNIKNKPTWQVGGSCFECIDCGKEL